MGKKLKHYGLQYEIITNDLITHESVYLTRAESQRNAIEKTTKELRRKYPSAEWIRVKPIDL